VPNELILTNRVFPDAGPSPGTPCRKSRVEHYAVPYKAFLLLLLLPGVLMACGPAPDREAIIPPPGAMIQWPLTPAPETSPRNLLPNGDFQEWYGGFENPTGFSVPNGTMASFVARDVMYGHLDTLGYTARQTWQKVDHDTDPDSRFGTDVDVAPGQTYRFSAVAAADPGLVAQIDAFARDESGELRLVKGALVEVNQEAPSRYTGTFDTGEATRINLRTKLSPVSSLPGGVSWSAWELTEAQSADELTGINALRAAWLRNTRDHLQQQHALYGGASGWSAQIYPIEKNLGRVYREVEAQPERAILGYDRFVFQKLDLNYLVHVRDFVGTSTETGYQYRPAFRALVALDRTLRNQGKTLLLIPVPDRIHLYADKIHKPASELPPAYLPHHQLIATLVAHDVAVTDVAPLLKHRRHEGHAVYWATDYEVPSDTLGELAAYTTPWIQELVGSDAREAAHYTVTEKELPLRQQAVAGLAPGLQKAIIGETQTMLSVTDGEGQPFAPAAESAVLVAGPFARLYEAHGASLAAQFSQQLGFPVSVLERPVEFQEVPRYLMDNDSVARDAAKIVVFALPEYALLRPGW